MTGAAAGRGEVVWSPAPDAFETSNLGRFAVAAGFTDERSLTAWSIESPAAFWDAFTRWIGVRWHDRPTATLVPPPDAGSSMPGAVWFPGGTLNYAEHALAAGGGLVSLSDGRDPVSLDGPQLADAVARCRAGLVALGVTRGDRVVAFMPNIAETMVAFLATASLGAVWSSCAPEFGVRAVIDRWSQLDPVVMLTIDGYRYGSRSLDRRGEVAEIVGALRSLRHVVALPYLFAGADVASSGLPSSVSVITWDHLCEPRDGAAGMTFEAVPFDHPLYVLFSSGTTGLPKPIVHGHGGVTIEHLKVLSLHHGLGPGDRFMWFTTTGWMMWNYLASGLLVGATIVLFDGDPASPDLMRLWRIAADERANVLGLSAPFIMASSKAGLEPGRDLDLGALRQLGSTGAPLPADGFRWIRDHVGAHVQPNSISGGTDVCTAFVGMSPVLPVRAGEISTRLLGCDVRAAAPDGSTCAPGETGELVVGSPMPSMPVGLWGDHDGSRYRATYFETFPGLWHHGDWITFHDDGACEISGRSDATLNRGGVRLGTSDFYAVVEAMPEVADSVVVHLEDPDGSPGTLVLLIACAPGATLDDDLRSAIVGALRRDLSPRHVPDVIDAVRAIPRTLSGKKLEVPIKRLLLGEDPERVASRGSLADPSALDDVAAWASAFRSDVADRSGGAS
jgi:acetoacetyl-CoA synthetase